MILSRLGRCAAVAAILLVGVEPALAQRRGGGPGGGGRPSMGMGRGGGPSMGRPGLSGGGFRGPSGGGMRMPSGPPRGLGGGGGSMRMPSGPSGGLGGSMRMPSGPSGGLGGGGNMRMPSGLGRGGEFRPPSGGLTGARPGLSGGRGPSLGSSDFARPSRPSVGGDLGSRIVRPPSGGNPAMGSPSRPALGSTRPGLSGGDRGPAAIERRSAMRPPIESGPGLGRGSINLGGRERPPINPGGSPSIEGGPARNPRVAGSPSERGGRPGLGLNDRPGIGGSPRGIDGSGPTLGSRPRLDGSPSPDRSARPGLGLGERPGINPRGPDSDRTRSRSSPGERPALSDRSTPGGRPAIGAGERPGLGNRPGLADRSRGPSERPAILPGERPGLGNRPGTDNRPGLVDRGRSSIGAGERPGLGRSWNGSDRFGRDPRWFGGGRGGNWGGRGDFAHGKWGGRPFDNLHRAWINGYWTGYNDGFIDGTWLGSTWGGWGGWGGWGWGGWGPGLGFGGWGWGLNNGWGWFGFGLGLGLNYAFSPWGYGGGFGYGYGWPYYEQWGYNAYYNPYYLPVAVQPIIVGDATTTTPIVYDYSQPIEPAAAPPEPTVTDEAMAVFDQARAAFKSGNYDEALRLTDQALVKLPQDATLHEFRALVLFALRRFDEAASVLYAVLNVGPGWNWPTLIGLYPSVDVYTAQLRALEAECNARPDAAAPRFVLAYHYLTADHREQAATMLRSVVRLQPNDALSAKLLATLDPAGAAAIAPAPPAANPAPNAPAGPELNAPAAAPAAEKPAAAQFSMVGTWKAEPPSGPAITLTVKEDGQFSWNVAAKDDQPERTIQGNSTFGNNGLLTLAGGQNQGALVGQVTWTDADHFHFQLSGAPPADPGLNFTRVP